MNDAYWQPQNFGLKPVIPGLFAAPNDGFGK
jgi:hypothetical protein